MRYGLSVLLSNVSLLALHHYIKDYIKDYRHEANTSDMDFAI